MKDWKKVVTTKSSWQLFLERFKFEFDLIEKGVRNLPGSYQGLDSRALYTSQQDFQAIFAHPQVEGTFVDLGCGTGEGCLLYTYLYPDRRAVGVDFEFFRIQAGLKVREELKLLNTELIHADLLKDSIPGGDTYFLYFPTGMVLDRILSELYLFKNAFRIVAIESHGDLFPRLQKENWLKEVGEVPLSSERHHPMAKIFEKMMVPRSSTLMPHELSFKERFLLLQDADSLWLGESLGLEWTHDERYELQTPPRTIEWGQVKGILSFDQVPVNFHEALKIRRLGEVRISTPSGEFTGYIRKIIIEPTFHLEISSGAKVEWNHIVTITQGSTLCYASSSV